MFFVQRRLLPFCRSPDILSSKCVELQLHELNQLQKNDLELENSIRPRAEGRRPNNLTIDRNKDGINIIVLK